jgi:SAM-dependent methyltransferase
VLACPDCHKPFTEGRCACRRDWTETGGVADLYVAGLEAGELPGVSDKVRGWYEERSAAGFRADETRASLESDPPGQDPVLTALLAEARPGARVVDLGCGAGRRALRLGLAGFEVVGVDLAVTPLLRGESFRRRIGAHSVSFVRGNLFRPPLVPRSVDYVLATNVVDETGDPAQATVAAAQLVRPGGWLVVSVRAYRLPWFEEEATGDPDTGLGPERSRHSLDEVCGWLAAAGIAPATLADGAPPPSMFSATGSIAAVSRLARSFAWTMKKGDGPLFVAGRKSG